MLYRLKCNNQRWRKYTRMLVRENRWRAQRYGIDEGLIDFGRGEIVPYADLLEEIIEITAVDADELGCVDEIAHARQILTRGTSAHRQVEVYEQALAQGAEKSEALVAVVDFLIEETMAGTD
jgi:carboxylate-amine ligase